MNSQAASLVGKNEIQQYIPQRAPIVMVDELVNMDEHTTQTRFTPDKDNFFIDEGLFRESGLIEHMAQSAAAGVGYWYKSQNKEVPLGYIGAVQKFKLEKLTAANKTLETKIETLHQVMTTKVIKATVSCNEELIATCEMKIFIDESTTKE